MLDSPVIPLKFGTYADDDGQIVEILRCGRIAFAEALEKYADKVEVDLAAFWADLRAVLAEIGGHEVVVSMKARIARQAEPTMEQRVQLGQLVKQLLDHRRDQVAGELRAALKKNWPQAVFNPARDDSMILNAAFLVGRNEQAQFDRGIGQLNHYYEDWVNFRCVGPLPPYSFATAEVRTIEASRLDAARRLLGLGDSASLAEIKTAHRRLLQEAHPDRNPDDGAADRTKEISAAYELLEEYALNFKHTFNAAQGGPVIVKVRSLNDLRAGTRAFARGGQPRRPECVAAEAA
jgi:hypothetical protein